MKTFYLFDQICSNEDILQIYEKHGLLIQQVDEHLKNHQGQYTIDFLNEEQTLEKCGDTCFFFYKDFLQVVQLFEICLLFDSNFCCIDFMLTLELHLDLHQKKIVCVNWKKTTLNRATDTILKEKTIWTQQNKQSNKY